MQANIQLDDIDAGILTALSADSRRSYADVAAEVATGAVGSVLVKGSRFMRMERVVQALCALDPTQEPDKKDKPHAA